MNKFKVIFTQSEQGALKIKNKILIILAVAYVFNFADRQILTILIESVKHDLQLTDLQIGMLIGPAFGLFYSILSIPFAILSDRFNRKWIISVSIFLWSLMTIFCGFAKTFIWMMIPRIGVGIGQSGLNPGAISTITDLFSKEKRGRAISIYQLGIPFGIMLGTLVSGVVAEFYGWRYSFYILGSIGMILVVLMILFSKEPERGGSDKFNGNIDHDDNFSFKKSMSIIFSRQSFVYACLGGSCNALFIVGV